MNFNECMEKALENLPLLKPEDLVPDQVYSITGRKIVSSPHGRLKTVLVTLDEEFMFFLPARFQTVLLNNEDSIPMRENEVPVRIRFLHHKTVKFGKTTPIFEVVRDDEEIPATQPSPQNSQCL